MRRDMLRRSPYPDRLRQRCGRGCKTILRLPGGWALRRPHWKGACREGTRHPGPYRTLSWGAFSTGSACSLWLLPGAVSVRYGPARLKSAHLHNQKALSRYGAFGGYYEGGRRENPAGPCDNLRLSCQNLSLIGNRSGLAGAKSSLFYQAFRIIQEMRDATDNLYPAIAVWENVMGAFSTNDRMDFRAVLSAFSDTEVPMPPSGRWGNAGMVRGERLMCAGGSWTPSIGQAPEGWHEGSGFSSWRTLEADVPQTYYLSPVNAPTSSALRRGRAGRRRRRSNSFFLKQGGRYQSSTPFSASVCGERQKAGRNGLPKQLRITN